MQDFSFLQGTYSHRGSPPGNQKMLNAVSLPLLKAGISILALTEQKNPVPRLHEDSAEK